LNSGFTYIDVFSFLLVVILLFKWLYTHFDEPYPTEQDKEELALATGLTAKQVNYWMINARVRLWKPAIARVRADGETEAQAATGADAGMEAAATAAESALSIAVAAAAAAATAAGAGTTFSRTNALNNNNNN